MPISRLLLVRFPWAVADAVDAWVASAAPVQRPRLYRSLGGSEGYAWLPEPTGVDATAMRDCTPGITLADLEPLESFEGAAAGRDAPFRYVARGSRNAVERSGAPAVHEHEANDVPARMTRRTPVIRPGLPVVLPRRRSATRWSTLAGPVIEVFGE